MSSPLDSTWLIEDGHLICPASGLNRIGRLLIHEGKIAAIDPADGNIPPNARSVDARGLIIAPGLVDISTELGEPGNEEDETIASGTLAALAGGFTTVACASNTDPPLDTAAAVEFVKQKAARSGHCRVHVIGCVRGGAGGDRLAGRGWRDCPKRCSKTAQQHSPVASSPRVLPDVRSMPDRPSRGYQSDSRRRNA
jgi:dihydroorotase